MSLTRLSAAPVLSTLPDGTALEGASVLIVEDEFIIAEYAREVLSACAVKVAVATDVVEARAMLNEPTRFNAAILNVKLADRVSYSLAERLTEARVPFAFASGFDHLKLRADGFGAVAWLPKPYTPNKLLRMVAGLIGIGSRRKAACKASSAIAPNIVPV
jgi:DNA-binding response OmpR family regulator